MYHFLSKTLDVAFDPLWWAATLALVGTGLLLRGSTRVGRALLVAGPAALLVLSLPPVANRLWASLEEDAPNTWQADKTYDVVVLMGGVLDEGGCTQKEPAWGNNVERFMTVFDVLRTKHARMAILTGGVPRIPAPEARVLGDQLVAWGIERDRLLLDETARDTQENAEQAASLAKAAGFSSVLVVTSAFHVKRTLVAFRSVGLSVDVLPVDYRMREPARESDLAPRTRYLNESASALHEWAGRLTSLVRLSASSIAQGAHNK